MISTKKLIKLARKWRKIAVSRRKRIAFPRSKAAERSNVGEKGQFVVYTTNERQFALPLAYLESQLVRELLRLSEEEFGSVGDGPITLPYDSSFMEYVVAMIQQNVARELEEALILHVII